MEFILPQIRDYRTDWDLEVNQPVAGNYYPVCEHLYIISFKIVSRFSRTNFQDHVVPLTFSRHATFTYFITHAYIYSEFRLLALCHLSRSSTSNYYPSFWFIMFFILSFQINLGIYIKDNKTEFSVLVDRSIGGSSLEDGQIDLMVHRYCFSCCFKV